MSTKYTTVSVSGYNSSPPADDGSVTEANKLKWSNHKIKLGDPLKTAIESINTKLVAALDYTPTTQTTNYTTTATDAETAILSTSGVTISLGDAASMGAGYRVAIKNASSSGIVTVGRITSANQIDGAASDITLQALESAVFVCDGTHYYIVSGAYSRSYLVPTGSVQAYIGTTAPTGWVLLDGNTIGDASSGATRANADTEELFTLLWNSMADAQAAVSSGRGASAAADYAAHKTITLPDMQGRSVIGTGTGATTGEGDVAGTARTHGDIGGYETHTLTIPEMPAHTHALTATSTAGGGSSDSLQGAGSHVTGSTGGGGAHANMMPWLALNFICKL